MFAQGSIVDPSMAAAIVRQRQADAVEMTRALIADPGSAQQDPRRLADEVRPCTSVNQLCVIGQVQNPRLSCVNNPAAGYEGTPEFAPLTRAPVHHRVMVVGAGPAGLEAARVAAVRGHAVTDLRAQRPAGRCAAARRPRHPRRERLDRAVDWLEAQVRKLQRPHPDGRRGDAGAGARRGRRRR